MLERFESERTQYRQVKASKEMVAKITGDRKTLAMYREEQEAADWLSRIMYKDVEDMLRMRGEVSPASPLRSAGQAVLRMENLGTPDMYYPREVFKTRMLS